MLEPLCILLLLGERGEGLEKLPARGAAKR